MFNCSWRHAWKYLLAQLTGGGLAALVAVGVYGVGPYFREGGADAANREGGYVGFNTRDDGLRQGLMEGGVREPAGPRSALE